MFLEEEILVKMGRVPSNSVYIDTDNKYKATQIKNKRRFCNIEIQQKLLNLLSLRVDIKPYCPTLQTAEYRFGTLADYTH